MPPKQEDPSLVLRRQAVGEAIGNARRVVEAVMPDGEGEQVLADLEKAERSAEKVFGKKK